MGTGAGVNVTQEPLVTSRVLGPQLHSQCKPGAKKDLMTAPAPHSPLRSLTEHPHHDLCPQEWHIQYKPGTQKILTQIRQIERDSLKGPDGTCTRLKDRTAGHTACVSTTTHTHTYTHKCSPHGPSFSLVETCPLDSGPL